MNSVRKQLIEKFNGKEYRDAFIAEQIFTRLPLKIRFLREAQELTQKQLGQRARIAQTWVSKLEDPSYGKLTISTLLKVASALDVGLQIDFVPFSRVLDSAVQMSMESFAVPSFKDDAGLTGQDAVLTHAVALSPAIGMGTVIAFPQRYTSSVNTGDVHTPPRSASPAAGQAHIA